MGHTSQDGNLIAEADAATGEILREYFSLGLRPVTVVDAAADGQIYAGHVDHLDRRATMTDHSGTVVWQASPLVVLKAPLVCPLWGVH